MKVVVRYLAQARHAAGVASETVELVNACSVAELLAHAARQRNERLRQLLLDARGALQPSILCFVADHQVGVSDSPLLRDGDVVTVLSPMAGG